MKQARRPRQDAILDLKMAVAMTCDWLQASARASPHRLALSFAGQSWSYAELDRAVDLSCTRLAARGLCAGHFLATHLPATPQHVMLLHAAARMGLHFVALNIRLTANELKAHLDHLQARVLICDDETKIAQLGKVASVETLADFSLRDPAERFQTPPFMLENMQGVVFTSGSTGMPKAVEMSFTNYFYNAHASAARLGTLPDDRWLCCLPLHHIGGQALLFRACLQGTAVLLHSHFDVQHVSNSIDHEAISMVSLVPTMLKRLLDLRKTFPPTLRCILLGGAAADEALLRECAARRVPIAITYGMTEAASQIATSELMREGFRAGRVGHVLPFIQVRIVDEHGIQLGPEQTGEICVRGPTLMRGYYNNPEATQRALHNGELRTGDIGMLDKEGALWVFQRRVDLIISGGENIFPNEVQAVLKRHVDVEDALVLGMPDAQWGQRVAALVVPRGGAHLDADALIAHCRPHLAGYKIPRIVRFLDALPMTSNGKPDRKAAVALLSS